MSTEELAPRFEAVLMPHDGIVDALAKIRGDALLPVDATREILVTSQKYPYRQLTQKNGAPYAQMLLDGVVKRFYVFADGDDDTNPARMVALRCSVARDPRSGQILVMPEVLLRGPEADFVMSVKYGCCTAGGRTMIYSDTSRTRGVFANVASSGTDVRAEIRSVWNNVHILELDAAGQAALQHLALDMTGRCTAHEKRANYTIGGNWAGRPLVPS